MWLALMCLLLVGSMVALAGQTAPGGGWWGWKNGYYRYIARDKQFFVDNYIIEEMQNLKRVLNQPVKYERNPVLSCDQPWETGCRCGLYGCVLYDEEESVFKMWYGLRNSDQHLTAVAYATSRDGIHWDKPKLSVAEFGGTTDNNVVFGPPRPPTKEEADADPTMRPMYEQGLRDQLEGAIVIKDVIEKDPAKRYKMLFRGPPLAYFMVNGAYSPDGIHWRGYKENPIIPLRSDSSCNVLWDPAIDRYVAFLRFWIPFGEDEPNYYPGRSYPGGPNVRAVGRSESRDFIHWTPAEVIMTPDEKDDPAHRNFYGMQVMRHGGVYFGFLSVLRADDHMYMQLAFSRDGRRWIRAGDRGVFLPTGSKGAFDWGMVYTFQSQLVVGDEIWIYYGGHKNLHGQGGERQSSIGLAKLRLDGFVCIEAGDEEGVLTTKPFKFKGNKLVINADATGGELNVEILEYKNMYHSLEVDPIPGFTRDECIALKENEIRHTATWKNGSDLTTLQGKTIKLKFNIRHAKLYSFQFKD